MNFNQIQVGDLNDCPPFTTTYASSYDFSETIIYGWTCPKCGRVYSPSTPMCLYCKSNDNNIIVSDKISLDDYYIHYIDPLKTPQIHLDSELFMN